MNFKNYFELCSERVFHGTRHKISDRFNLKYIGNGEGAQTFGWGLYFAENKKVAHSYRYSGDRLNVTTKEPTSNGYINKKEAVERVKRKEPVFAKDFYSDWYSINSVRDIVYADRNSGNQFASELKESGYLYEVEIDASQEELLDLDKPLDQQSSFIKSVLKDSIADYQSYKWKTFKDGSGHVVDADGFPYNNIPAFSEDDLKKHINGPAKNFYFWAASILGSDKSASFALLDKGIKGLMYYDQHSRKDETGTRNFVIFDDSIIHIKNEE